MFLESLHDVNILSVFFLSNVVMSFTDDGEVLVMFTVNFCTKWYIITTPTIYNI